MIILNDLEGTKNSYGKKQFIRHLKGEKLTRSQAIAAKCCECTCYFNDGMIDCGMKDCALHPYMHYNKNKVKSNRGRKKKD